VQKARREKIRAWDSCLAIGEEHLRIKKISKIFSKSYKTALLLVLG